MKNAFALLAAAAAGPAAATFGHGGFKGGFGGGVDVGFGGGVDLGFGFGKKFHDADRFTCPGNSKNKCDDKFRGGIDWKDLVPGKFEKYLGFDFNGFECIDLGGIGKVITGECGSDRDSAPRFGCGKDSFLDKFSVKEFDIDVEFDARLEFHYDMPDGSLCKQSSDCFKGLNKIINTQCGLATDVRVIFPDQPNKQKDKCKIKIPKIDFDCDDNTPEEPEVPEVPEEPEHPEEPEVPEHPEEPETPEEPEHPEEPEEPEEPETPEEPEHPEEPEEPETPEEPEHPEEPEEPEEPETPEPTFSHPPTNGTASSALPTQSSHTTPPQVTTTAPPTTEMTTSTIFTTEIKTITDCGPEVPDCPADGTKVVTETVAISTTVCPVDEVEPTATSAELPEEPEKPKPTGGNGVPELPDLELPCPDVVPKCLNTWLHVVKECKDNLDVSCFCPNKEFVEETYKCLYAHGENDDIVSEAVQFFQGICAPFIPENPGIVTDIDSITSCITVTGTPTVTSVPYTTIVVETTITEPCVSDGVTIPESSTTKTISTEITVPDVPVPTTPVEPVPTGSDELPVPPPTEAPEVPATQPPATTFFTTQPGTISQPVPTSQLPVPTAGAANVKAGLGLGLAVMAVAAAL